MPYIRSIRRGTTKAHVFSWVIWGLGTITVFLAQLAGHSVTTVLFPAAVGAGCIALVALLACRRRIMPKGKHETAA